MLSAKWDVSWSYIINMHVLFLRNCWFFIRVSVFFLASSFRLRLRLRISNKHIKSLPSNLSNKLNNAIYILFHNFIFTILFCCSLAKAIKLWSSPINVEQIWQECIFKIGYHTRIIWAFDYFQKASNSTFVSCAAFFALYLSFLLIFLPGGGMSTGVARCARSSLDKHNAHI